MGERLTTTRINKLKANGRSQWIPDSTRKGLGVLVTPTGHKAYKLRRRIRGIGVDVTLCDVSEMSPDEAWERAQSIIKDTEAVAEAAAKGVSPERAAREAAVAALKKPTVQDLWDAYVAWGEESVAKGELSPNTLRTFRQRNAKEFLAEHGSLDWDELTEDQILEHAATLTAKQDARHGGPERARQFVALVRVVWRHAMLNHPAVPASAARLDWKAILRALRLPPKGSHALALEDDELRQLYQAIAACYADGSINPVVLGCIELLLAVGGRKGEVQSITLDMIDREARVIRQPKHKTRRQTGRDRILRLSDHAMTVLERCMENRKAVLAGKGRYWPRKGAEQYLFPADANSGSLYLGNLNRPLAMLAKRAGMKHLKPHSLRSIYINIAIDSGVSIEVVAENVGHSSVATTMQHYTANKASKLVSGANAAGAALAVFVPEGLRQAA